MISGGKTVKYFYKVPLDFENNHDKLESFKSCMCSYCTFFRKGIKLYTCPTIGNIHHFNKYFNQNFLVTENAYIDIYKAKSFKEILEILTKPAPFCSYCNSKAQKRFKWTSTKHEITEWT